MSGLLFQFLERMRVKGLDLLARETPDRNTYADGYANGYWKAYTEIRAEVENRV